MVAVRGPRVRTHRAACRAFIAIDRLTADNTSGTGAHTFAYSYDSRGNILTNNETGTTITHTYDAASRLTTSIEGSTITTYTFDNNGNMTAAEKGSEAAYMAYTFENQLGYHEDESSAATAYFYDPFFHLKSEVKLAGSSAWFVWDEDLMVRVLGSGGQRSFSTNDGVIVGEVADLTGTPTTKSYLEDFLGSVTGEMSTSNVVSNSRRFTPYGRDWLGVPSVAHSPAWVGGHGYHPTGLKWAGYSVFHRVVTPETGQWTTRDPLWPAELPYAYVNGNPTTLVDPPGASPASQFEKCFRRLRSYPYRITRRDACIACKRRWKSKHDCTGEYFNEPTPWYDLPRPKPRPCGVPIVVPSVISNPWTDGIGLGRLNFDNKGCETACLVHCMGKQADCKKQCVRFCNLLADGCDDLWQRCKFGNDNWTKMCLNFFNSISHLCDRM